MKYFHLAIIATMGIFVAIQPPCTASAQPERVVVTDFALIPAQNNFKQFPKGWALTVWHGKPDVRLIEDEKDEKVLRMRSKKASISIHREMELDLKKFPVLSWKWKVTKLPEGADARNVESDDQAAGVYVVFPGFPSFINSYFIGYIWETNAPEGTILRSRKNPMVHYIVVRSGMADLGKWIVEKRNVLDDYQRVFGAEASKVGGIALMIDTDDTLSDAESFFATVEFEGDASRVSEVQRFERFAKAADSTLWVYE